MNSSLVRLVACFLFLQTVQSSFDSALCCSVDTEKWQQPPWQKARRGSIDQYINESALPIKAIVAEIETHLLSDHMTISSDQRNALSPLAERHDAVLLKSKSGREVPVQLRVATALRCACVKLSPAVASGLNLTVGDTFEITRFVKLTDTDKPHSISDKYVEPSPILPMPHDCPPALSFQGAGAGVLPVSVVVATSWGTRKRATSLAVTSYAMQQLGIQHASQRVTVEANGRSVIAALTEQHWNFLNSSFVGASKDLLDQLCVNEGTWLTITNVTADSAQQLRCCSDQSAFGNVSQPLKTPFRAMVGWMHDWSNDIVLTRRQLDHIKQMSQAEEISLHDFYVQFTVADNPTLKYARLSFAAEMVSATRDRCYCTTVTPAFAASAGLEIGDTMTITAVYVKDLTAITNQWSSQDETFLQQRLKTDNTVTGLTLPSGFRVPEIPVEWRSRTSWATAEWKIYGKIIRLVETEGDFLSLSYSFLTSVTKLAPEHLAILIVVFVVLVASLLTDSRVPALSEDKIKRGEHDFKAQRRTAARVDLEAKHTVGLSFSGGGIRSSAFCLGALEAFREAKCLHLVDYISSVSGGGHTAAAYLAQLVEFKDRKEAPQQVLGEAVDIVADRMRKHCGYVINWTAAPWIRVCQGMLFLAVIVVSVSVHPILVTLNLLMLAKALNYSFSGVLSDILTTIDPQDAILKLWESDVAHSMRIIFLASMFLFGLLGLIGYALPVGRRDWQRQLDSLCSLFKFGVVGTVFGFLVLLTVAILHILRADNTFNSAVVSVLLGLVAAFNIVAIFGGSKSQLEKFLNGLAFMLPFLLVLFLATVLRSLHSNESLLFGRNLKDDWWEVGWSSCTIMAVLFILYRFLCSILHEFYRYCIRSSFYPPNLNPTFGDLRGLSAIGAPFWVCNTVVNEISHPSGRTYGPFCFTPFFMGSTDVQYYDSQQVLLSSAGSLSAAAMNAGLGKHNLVPSAKLILNLLSLNMGTWFPLDEKGSTIKVRDLRIRRLPQILMAVSLGCFFMSAHFGDDQINFAAVGVSIFCIMVVAGFWDRGTWVTYSPYINMIMQSFGHAWSSQQLPPNICLSDGGHFENMGLMELLKRQVNCIFCFDASDDPMMTFEEMKEALVKFRPELARAGVRLSTVIPSENNRNVDVYHGLDKFREASDRVLTVEVLYESAATQTPGTIYYIKKRKVDNGNDNKISNLENGRCGDIFCGLPQQFPNHPTANQFYSPELFNKYCLLGQNAARDAIFRGLAERCLSEGEAVPSLNDPVPLTTPSVKELLMKRIPPFLVVASLGLTGWLIARLAQARQSDSPGSHLDFLPAYLWLVVFLSADLLLVLALSEPEDTIAQSPAFASERNVKTEQTSFRSPIALVLSRLHLWLAVFLWIFSASSEWSGQSYRSLSVAIDAVMVCFAIRATVQKFIISFTHERDTSRSTIGQAIFSAAPGTGLVIAQAISATYLGRSAFPQSGTPSFWMIVSPFGWFLTYFVVASGSIDLSWLPYIKSPLLDYTWLWGLTVFVTLAVAIRGAVFLARGIIGRFLVTLPVSAKGTALYGILLLALFVVARDYGVRKLPRLADLIATKGERFPQFLLH